MEVSMATVPVRPVVRPDGGGIPNAAFHLPRRLLLTAADTGGASSMWIEEVPPAAGPPLHIHLNEDEAFFVLEGDFRFQGGETVSMAGKGATVFIPRGTPHTFRNDGTASGRLLVTMTPGGFEGFFLAVDAEGLSPPNDMARIESLAAQFGLKFVGPPL
jgi:mannose-6-phosphate isomerase-like protein (cupin superfamily)